MSKGDLFLFLSRNEDALVKTNAKESSAFRGEAAFERREEEEEEKKGERREGRARRTNLCFCLDLQKC